MAGAGGKAGAQGSRSSAQELSLLDFLNDEDNTSTSAADADAGSIDRDKAVEDSRRSKAAAVELGRVRELVFTDADIARIVKCQAAVRRRLCRITYRKLSRRTLIMRELLETEGTYVKTLRLIDRWYIRPLTAHALQSPGHDFVILTAEEIDTLFSEIPELCKVHMALLNRLQERMDKWSAFQTIGDIFLDMTSANLDMYTVYVSNFDAAAAVISAHKTDSLFKKFLDEKRDFHGVKDSLSDLLITPVQRIPRYVMLLEQILKQTPSGHPDHVNLTLALQHIRRVAHIINDRKRAVQIVEDIQTRVLGLPESIVDAERYLALEADAIEVKSGRQKLRRLFLFNDVLLCTTPRMAGFSFSFSAKPLINQYQYKWKINLSDLDLKDSPQSVTLSKGIFGGGGDVVTENQYGGVLQLMHWKTVGSETITFQMKVDEAPIWADKILDLKKGLKDSRSRTSSFLHQAVLKKRDTMKRRLTVKRNAIPKFGASTSPTGSPNSSPSPQQRGLLAPGNGENGSMLVMSKFNRMTSSMSDLPSVAGTNSELREMLGRKLSQAPQDQASPVGEIKTRIAELEKEIGVEERILAAAENIRLLYKTQNVSKSKMQEIERQHQDARDKLTDLRAELALCLTTIQLHK